MSSPPNTNNRQNNSQAREYNRRGNPLGVLFGLLILGGACFGLYYLWKMKKNEITNIFPQTNQPNQQASSLNLNPNPDQTNKVQLNTPTSTTEISNTTNSYPNTNTIPPVYTPPPPAPPITGSSTKTAPRQKPKNIETQTQNLIYQSKDGRKRVLSGYSGVNANNNSIKAQSGKSASYISPDKVLPARGFIQGSLQSLISDNNKSVANGLPRPNQLIYFATNFYIKEKALLFASNKLKALGFYRTRLSSDEYDQGRPLIVEGLDQNNNQAFFFAKPNNNETLWKIEIYEANHIASK